MTATDPRRGLCVIGVAQQTTAPPGPAPEPLASWEQVARAAAADAGVPDALRRLDSLQVMFCQSWPYDDPTGRLAERLGISPSHRVYSGIGGTTPQQLVATTAAAMQRGELDLAVIVGAEALATTRAAKRAGDRLPWSHREVERSPYPWQPPPSVELVHEVFQAWETFPLWDTARRAARGAALETYAAESAATMAALTPIAAANPYAWRRRVLSAEQVGTPGPDNRYVGWPYTKHEVAVMDVDMAAAVLVATVERADALGVPDDRRVHLNASAYAEDPPGIAERDDMAVSAAMSVTTAAALDAAGATIDEVTAFDLYSCFPSSLHLACDALGLSPDDPRGLTVTGGLPYAGGPASGYQLHAIGSAVERLRAHGGTALITGVGMHLQKHNAAIYSMRPGWQPTADLQPEVARRQPTRVVRDTADGTATVAAYTIAHDRTNQPVSGLLVLDVAGGRTLARVRRADLLADATNRELVGAQVTVTSDGTTNEATW